MSDAEDFATLFASSVQARRLVRGQSVEGTIVGFGSDVALIDVGGKSEAVLDLAELRNDEGALDAAVGDRIQATVVSTAGGVTLSRRLARRAATDKQIESAFEAGLPVEGTVQGVVKGGYEIRVGQSRGFCPLSQIDSVRTADPEVHVGRAYTFRIVEFSERGRNIVLSRRAVLEEAQQARAAEVREAIVPGAVLTGRVVSVREYGAFVDLGGGIQGLLHASEMGWSRVDDAAQVVTPGQDITVKVLRVSSATESSPAAADKIALGLKQLTDDPWTTAPSRYHVGDRLPGRVTRLAEFGAFIELEPGIEGLAHASTFPPTGQRDAWRRQVPAGSSMLVEILTIDPDKKRIGLALVPEGTSERVASQGDAIVPGARLTGTVERHEPFGVLVFLAPGRTALMPMSETGLDKEADLAKRFPSGSAVEVIVLEADPAGRRIRVSHKAVRDADDTAELRAYEARGQGAGGGGFGSLADKLRGALRPGSGGD